MNSPPSFRAFATVVFAGVAAVCAVAVPWTVWRANKEIEDKEKLLKREGRGR